jgi:hypothetical protein
VVPRRLRVSCVARCWLRREVRLPGCRLPRRRMPRRRLSGGCIAGCWVCGRRMPGRWLRESGAP